MMLGAEKPAILTDVRSYLQQFEMDYVWFYTVLYNLFIYGIFVLYVICIYIYIICIQTIDMQIACVVTEIRISW